MHFLLYLTLFCCTILSQARGDDKWFYSMQQGQCSGNKLVDRYISKQGEQFMIKTSTYTWRGENVRINCLRVENRMNIKDGGHVKLVQGGPNYSMAILELETQLGKGMDFHVEIYGEPINSGYYYDNRL